jgi:hypothetical protein
VPHPKDQRVLKVVHHKDLQVVEVTKDLEVQQVIQHRDLQGQQVLRVVVEIKDLQETQEPRVQRDQPHLRVLQDLQGNLQD